MRFDTSLLTVPQSESEIAEFDWRNFPPVKLMGEKRCFSMIDECTSVVGKLITGSAFIHGQIEGLVFAEHVAVEQTGFVKGVIFCRSLTIFGRVNANVICDSLSIRDGGSLSAVLKYKSMRIDPGGAITGWMERRDGAQLRLGQAEAAGFLAAPAPRTVFSN